MQLWHSSPDAFIDLLRTAGLRRAYLVRPRGSDALRASHPALDSIASVVSADQRDFFGHQACFFEIGRESDHLLSACVHWTHRGQSAGGVRFWHYDTVESFVRDGLRLGLGMGRKNALAGLWWGGGKGVIARRADRDYRDRSVRDAVYRDYGRFVSSLRGCYITAEDVGTRPEDMAVIHSQTRFTTCIPETVGGSGNPSRPTAAGVVVAIEAALDHLGFGDLNGLNIAMQGLGNVSSFMIGDLLDHGVTKIVGTDVDTAAIETLEAQYPQAPLDLRLVDRDDTSIFAEPCDVLIPNAVGACLNERTIPLLQARIVCGAANNQIENPVADDSLLKERGVVYVPDFLANRMGIVNCANEQYGIVPGDPAIGAHLDREAPTGIFRRCQEVLRRSESSGEGTAHEARQLADELAREQHPMWPDRSRVIIDSLVRDGWA